MVKTEEIIAEIKEILLSIKCVESCEDCMFNLRNSSTCKHTNLLGLIECLEQN